MGKNGIKIGFQLFFFLVIFANTGICQVSHTGKIVFERRTNLYKKFTDDKVREWIKEKDKIRVEEFALYFNDTVATFKPIYSEVADQLNWTTTKNTVQQNSQSNNKTVILSFAGQELYVKDSMETRQWKITESTRSIAGYKCRKAVYEKNDSTTLYAWYSLEIAPSFGPEGFDGLPGMILGLATEDGGIIYFAKTVELIKVEDKDLQVDLKKKTTYNMKDLRTKLEKDFGDSPWGKRLFDDIFRWL